MPLKKNKYLQVVWSLIFGILLTALSASAQTPLSKSFTMQGILENQGTMVSGPVDFIFEAYDDPDPQVGTLLGTFNQNEVIATQGFFTVEIEFPNDIFTGDEVWIQTSVRRPNEDVYSELLPLQKATATPYALHALNAENAAQAEYSNDAGLLDGFDASTFLRTDIGGTVNSDVEVTGDVDSSTFTLNGITISDWSQISGGGGEGDNLGNHKATEDVEFPIGFGLRSIAGARLKTGPNGWTFQHWPGDPTAHSAIFRDFGGQQQVVVDKDGEVGIGIFEPQERLHVIGNAKITGAVTTGSLTVGGQCFRPRTLVRCWLPSLQAHLTWVDNVQECLNAGGTKESEMLILASCS